jgi:hypothetical protein
MVYDIVLPTLVGISIEYGDYIIYILSGWWNTSHPLEKCESQIGSNHPNYEN